MTSEPGDGEDVLAAARSRAAALVAGDAQALGGWLHPAFRWTSHTGDTFDRDGYLAANADGGPTAWRGQELEDPEVTVVREVGVLRCVVHDVIDRGSGPEHFRMPMTQAWVREESRWLLLAGHAGPRLA